jgi:hypothetical protein
MIDQLINKVCAAAAGSELVHAASALRRDGGHNLILGSIPLRPLNREEIAQLEAQGNQCGDWLRIRVADGFDWRRVRQCSFHGDVWLGRSTRQVRLSDGLELPTGLYQATLANCILGHDVLIRDVKLLANYAVADRALLHNCGTITCAAGATFGNGMALPIGIESGGRDVSVFAEIDVALAATVARSRGRREFLQQYERAVSNYTAQATSDRGLIGHEARVMNTPRVHNTYIGPHAMIDGATLVSDSTLLSSEAEPVRVASGACVTHGLLQWGSHVATLALVDRAVLTEHSHAERHGKVTNSILGPNSGVAEGEVTACLLGPFVSFHHQALLIATLWPEGRGNVAYGANVGSNHTSKAPDQEFWPGEGMFLGLGVNVKFPADFTQAPYTIMACGVTSLPQKVRFPFSLVNTPSSHHADISPAFNEIIPAWLLTDNLYTLNRNEAKYQARNKARRTQLTFEIFRPDIVDLLRDACRRLEGVRQIKPVYTDRDIDGLGKNYLQEQYRQPAIEAYHFFITYYALLQLKAALQKAWPLEGDSTGEQWLQTPSNDLRWEHARRILCEELGLRTPFEGLRRLPAMLMKVAQDVERSKAKDDERGERIIDDYAEVHVAAAEDPFVRRTWEETRRMKDEVQELMAHLENGRVARPPAGLVQRNGSALLAGVPKR